MPGLSSSVWCRLVLNLKQFIKLVTYKLHITDMLLSVKQFCSFLQAYHQMGHNIVCYLIMNHMLFVVLIWYGLCCSVLHIGLGSKPLKTEWFCGPCKCLVVGIISSGLNLFLSGSNYTLKQGIFTTCLQYCRNYRADIVYFFRAWKKVKNTWYPLGVCWFQDLIPLTNWKWLWRAIR